jgi:hypothetical protein
MTDLVECLTFSPLWMLKDPFLIKMSPSHLPTKNAA